MVRAVVAASRFADEAQAAGAVAAPLERLARSLLFLPFGDVLFVVVALLQVPDGWPSVMCQVRLVFRVQVLEHFRSFPAQSIIVGR